MVKCLNCGSTKLNHCENKELTLEHPLTKQGIVGKKSYILNDVSISTFISCEKCGLTFGYEEETMKNGSIKITSLYEFD